MMFLTMNRIEMTPTTCPLSYCNSSSPPLIDIVLFGLPLKFFKTCLSRRSFHTLIKNASFPSPTNMGSHNPPRGLASSLALVPLSNLQPMWDLTIQPRSRPNILVGTCSTLYLMGSYQEMVCCCVLVLIKCIGKANTYSYVKW